MLSIAANDLKTKGIAAIEAGLAQQTEAAISVRGQQRYVVMPMEQYHFLRECELDAALAETRADIAAGRYEIHTAASHQAAMEKALAEHSLAQSKARKTKA
jgi:hypothetical protein